MTSSSESTPTASLAAIAEHFALGKLQSSTRTPGTNQSYQVTTERGTYLFKILINTTIEDIVGSLPFLQRLKEYGFSKATVYLQAPSGEIFYHSPSGDALVLAYLPGSMAEPSPTVNREVGIALAQLHQVPCDHLPPKRHWLDAPYLPEAIEAAVQMYGAEPLHETLNVFHTLDNFQPATFPQSLVHGDLDPSNCLFQQGQLIAFLDWQEIGVSAAILDFASTVLGFCFVESQEDGQNWHAEFDPQAYAALYDGYISVRPFSTEEKAHIGDALKYVGLTQPVWSMLKWEQYHPGEEMQETQTLYWRFGLNQITLPTL